MSAEVQAVGFLCLLAVAAGGVTLSVLPSIGRRARQMQITRERRESEARTVVEASSSSRFAEALVASSAPVLPNYHRSDEYQLVNRPPGDTHAWAIDERVIEPEPAAEVVEEPEPVAPTPEPSPWMRVALDDEPTPLAPGPVPALERWETFTEGWVRKPRAELLEELRSGEYELAKGDQAA